MNNNVLSVSYKNYTLTQRYIDNGDCVQTYYKSGKYCHRDCGIECTPKSTKKQLYRYLRYIVDSKKDSNLYLTAYINNKAVNASRKHKKTHKIKNSATLFSCYEEIEIEEYQEIENHHHNPSINQASYYDDDYDDY